MFLSAIRVSSSQQHKKAQKCGYNAGYKGLAVATAGQTARAAMQELLLTAEETVPQ